MNFRNTYEDSAHADEYARLEFANTYHLAYRDLPQIIREHVRGTKAMDFGCGTGRSTRFLRKVGLDPVGVDIAPEMVAKARDLDPTGKYQLIPEDDLSGFAPASFDLVLSVFTFDNVSGVETKVRIFRDLAALLHPRGKLISVVSAPEIYWHEWASFSTKDFPENRHAKAGELVKIVTTDFSKRRLTEDIIFPDESYRDVYARASLRVLATYKPLAKGDEPYQWVNETKIAPWVIYVLGPPVPPTE